MTGNNHSKTNSKLVTAIFLGLSATVISGCVTYNEVETPPTPKDYRGNKSNLVFEIDKGAFGPDVTREFQILQSGDALKIVLAGDSVITGDYPIPPNGQLELPLIGTIQTRNRTASEVQAELIKRSKTFYEEPLFQITVTKYADRFAYLFGAFRHPGAISLNAGDTLMTVMAKAGGLENRENALKQPLGMPRMARVIRENKHVATISLPELVSGRNLASNIALQPGDMVYVERDDAPTITILGEVRRPGLQGLTPGMDLVQALAQAGGLTEDADEDEVRVIRRWWTDKPELFEIDMDYLQRGEATPALVLEDRDLIYVRPNNLATVNYYIRQLTGPFNTASSVAPAPTGG